jgi:hypothetical protein
MSNVATSLLDFILDLLSDPEAAAEFHADAQGALEDAGLGDLCAADVDAILPMLADFAPVGVAGGSSGGSADDDDEDGSNSGHRPHDDDDGHRPDHGHGSHDDDDNDGYLAIEHIKHIQNHYTYSPTTTIDASHSVWGDSYKIWAEDEAVVAVNGAIAAGDDVKDSDIDNSVRDSYNEIDVEGDGNAVGRGNEVEDSFTVEDSFNTDLDVDVEDSFNHENSGNTVEGDGIAGGEDNEATFDHSTEIEVEDSFNEETTTEVEVEDSFNDNSTDLDVDVEDSFNEDNSTEIDVELEDSFNEENTVEIEEIAVAVDDSIASVGDPEVEVD